MADEYTFTLSRDDYDLLLMMMHYATCAALELRERKLFREFLRLANEVNKNNPNYRPYELPPEEPDHA